MVLSASVGRPPVEDRSKVRTHAATTGWIQVPNQPFEEGRKRELPPLPRGMGLYPARTMAWWETVRTMPHAALWSDSDWAFAEDTAVVHAQFWMGKLDKACELRIRERLMFMTEESRRAGKIRYVDAPTELTSVGTSVIPLEIRKPLVRKPKVRAMDPESK